MTGQLGGTNRAVSYFGVRENRPFHSDQMTLVALRASPVMGLRFAARVVGAPPAMGTLITVQLVGGPPSPKGVFVQ